MSEGADRGRRRPGAVADDAGPDDAGPDDAGRGEAGPAGVDRIGAEVGRGADTDADGTPDTLLTVEGADLLVHTDLDDDGLADRVLRLGPDGSVHPDPAADALTADPVHPIRGPDPARDPEGPDDPDGPDGHRAAAAVGGAPGPWTVLGRLFGLGA